MMKSLQDKVCDALTLVGLLAVIGLGSASLLPESPEPEKAEEAATADSTLLAPTDTLTEVPTPVEPVRQEEAKADTLATDSLELPQEEPADTSAAAHAAKQHQEAESGQPAEHHHESVHPAEHPADPAKAKDSNEGHKQEYQLFE